MQLKPMNSSNSPVYNHNASAQRVRMLEPSIVWELANTEKSSREIAAQFGVSSSTVSRIAATHCIDMRERNRLAGAAMRKRTAKSKSAGAIKDSVLHETMTQDGESIRWLSKEWK